jgi:hypothetical protein
MAAAGSGCGRSASEARPGHGPCGGGRGSAFPAPQSGMMKKGDGYAAAPPGNWPKAALRVSATRDRDPKARA